MLHELQKLLNHGENEGLSKLLDARIISLFGKEEKGYQGSVEAWFLGHEAGNADELERLLIKALRDHVYLRRNYHPGDEPHITPAVKRSKAYTANMDNLEKELFHLLDGLKQSLPPFFSMRYQGHMISDLTLPGILGYFATLLYNPNNVALETSYFTTYLEQRVGRELCQMLGYRPDGSDGAAPWGHITCGGTVANIEALWSARNLKYLPLSIHAAVREHDFLGPVLEMPVTRVDGWQARFKDLSAWDLLNLGVETGLNLFNRIIEGMEIDADRFADLLEEQYFLQTLGYQAFLAKMEPHYQLASKHPAPVIFVSGSKHYSFPKAASLLGLGSVVNIETDIQARMDVHKLDQALADCVANQKPVLTVVAVMGSTEESAVDDLAEILRLREHYREQGLEFTVHADAAWGGYMASLLHEPEGVTPSDRLRMGPESRDCIIPLSTYVETQFRSMSQADSITVDPHKMGYLPYPIGAVCYRNATMKELVTFGAPYINTAQAKPKEGQPPPLESMGIYGIEGSKPGAAAASIYLSHRVIHLNKEGYGRIIGQSMYLCKCLYLELLRIESDDWLLVPLPHPAPRGPKAEPLADGAFAELAKSVYFCDDDESMLDRVARDEAWFRQLGPDQNILVYAFNPIINGKPNTDPATAYAFNQIIAELLGADYAEKNIFDYNLTITNTVFHSRSYGRPFLENYMKRLGLDVSGDELELLVLRSTVMDPWIADNVFFKTMIKELRMAVDKAYRILKQKGVNHDSNI